MPGHHTFHGGSTLLLPLATAVGLRTDVVNFVVCQWVSFFLSIVFYHFLTLSRVSRNIRMFYLASIGMAICFFCFGTSIKHLIADSMICYLILQFAPLKYVHKLTFIFAMGYLSFIHLYRSYFAREYSLDITAPLMVLTQKLTSLAFSIHDGTLRSSNDLTPTQKREIVRKIPSPLEFFSYTFQYMNILCGPLCFYTDFLAFVDGAQYLPPNTNNNYLSDVEKNANCIPTPWPTIKRKLVFCIIFMLLNAFAIPRYPTDGVFEIEGYFYKLFYVVWSVFLLRTQYYYAWMTADAISNAAGFGFNGYDENGNSKWDLISNADAWKVESSENLRGCLEGWNIGTMHWLRRVAYERTPKSYRVVVTYIVSAWWHGFFAGYYVTFLTAALFTEAARTARRYIRPYFLNTRFKLLYNFVTFIATRLGLTYLGVGFILLHTGPTFKFYSEMYFSLHILAILILGLIPLIVPKKMIAASVITEIIENDNKHQ